MHTCTVMRGIFACAFMTYGHALTGRLGLMSMNVEVKINLTVAVARCRKSHHASLKNIKLFIINDFFSTALQ